MLHHLASPKKSKVRLVKCAGSSSSGLAFWPPRVPPCLVGWQSPVSTVRSRSLIQVLLEGVHGFMHDLVAQLVQSFMYLLLQPQWTPCVPAASTAAAPLQACPLFQDDYQLRLQQHFLQQRPWAIDVAKYLCSFSRSFVAVATTQSTRVMAFLNAMLACQQHKPIWSSEPRGFSAATSRSSVSSCSLSLGGCHQM